MALSTRQQATLGLLALAGIAAFLPWATAEIFGTSISKSGIDGGDGWLVVLVAGAGIASMFVNHPTARVWGPPVAGILLAVIGIVEYGIFRSDLADDASGVASSIVHVGIGIPLIVLGGAAAAFASWPRKPTAPQPLPLQTTSAAQGNPVQEVPVAPPAPRGP
ncbi:MAG TPA: hypothetical protein VM286_06845 [Candidatus Thermoplasmatota archaeon]|nr:hypothetical protein [Candidatus Thermoplasmatota archaeon]